MMGTLRRWTFHHFLLWNSKLKTFQNNRIHFSAVSHWKTFCFWRLFDAIFFDFFPCFRVLMVQIFSNCRLQWFLSSFKLLFLRNWKSIFSKQGFHHKFSVFREGLTWKTFCFDPFFRFAWVQNCEKCFLVWFRSLLKLVYLSHYKFEFNRQSLNSKHYTCRGRIMWRIVDFVLCSKILIVPKKITSRKFLSRYSISASFSATTTSFNSSIKISIESFLTEKKIVGNFLLFFLQRSRDSHEFL